MKRRLPTIIFSLLMLLLVLSSCTAPEILSFFPKLEGYWRYESYNMMFGAGFTQIIQNNDQITMRSITETNAVNEEHYRLEYPGLVRSDERKFLNNVILFSGETLPPGTYTQINRIVADITDNEIKFYQEFRYILYEGIERLYTQSDEMGSFVRALKPEGVSEWLQQYTPKLEVQTSYGDFIAGEIYAITFNIISDEDLPNMSTVGSITLTCNQKSFTLDVDEIHWFNIFSLIDYGELKFVLINATHTDFTFASGCHNNNNTHVLEGPARVDGTKIGEVIF